MYTLFYILIGTGIISLLSLIGISTFFLKVKIEKITDLLVALSIGALIGGAFLHLIPEAVEQSEYSTVFLYVAFGFLLFFFVEKLFHWRHCHKENCKIHSYAYMSLFGDSIHNLIDGIIIAVSFITSYAVGVASVFAIAIHEIPQEIGDFGVLVHAGMSKKKALMFNFLTALTAVAGAIFGFFLFELIDISLIALLAVAAGGFIYVSASDLIPKLREERNFWRSLAHLAIIILGILIMYLLKGVA